MNDELERVFDEALALLEQGAGIDAIVAHYPAQAAELRSFLLTAARLSRLATQPSLSAEAQSKRAFLAAAATPTAARRPAVAGRLSRLAAGLLALLVVFLLSGSALVGASASAAPGSALYGTKRLVESVRLALATDPERAATLRERFRRERLAEVAQLLATDRFADVSLTGVIEAINDYGQGEAHWTVDGLPVVVDEQTTVDGRPTVGALVEIDGRTAGDAVRATRVMVLSAGLPEPTPAPSPTPATATPAPAPDDDDAATAAPGIAPLATATPTATAPPTASPTASPSPTLPPPPAPTDDNSNDNDDNSNDNGGDDNVNDNDDNSNDNGGDDNVNDNDDNGNDNGGDDNANDNGGDDNANDNGGDDNANDNGDDDNANDNDNSNDNDDGDNSGSGGGDNDNGGGDDDEGD